MLVFILEFYPIQGEQTLTASRIIHSNYKIVICVSRPKKCIFFVRVWVFYLLEAQPRLENRRGQKALFDRGAHNVFRVHLSKDFEKHELIVHFEVIFDRCQIYIFSYTYTTFHVMHLGKRTRKNYLFM
jgi:hypothetical protein